MRRQTKSEPKFDCTNVDASYRSSLSEAEQALLPEHPTGAIELHAGELELVSGAADQEAATFMTKISTCD